MKNVFDPHIHLFDQQQGDYFWQKEGNPPFWPNKEMLRVDVGVNELALEPPFRFVGAVHIEAGFDNERPERELTWLESLPFSLGPAVSFVDISLSPKEFANRLTALSHPLLTGIRHITEGEDWQILFARSVVENLTLLVQKGLIFEAQFEVSNREASERLLTLAQQLTDLQIVINHAGLVTQDNYACWHDNIALLARQPNIAVKASGWELGNVNYSDAWVKKVITHLIEVFGDNRVMLASNFPLCRFAKSYQALWQMYASLGFGDGLWQQIACENARAVYLKGRR